MNYSYLMGIENVSELKARGFIIEEIDGDFGIKFSKDKENEYEEFLVKNLDPGYWNEYLGEEIVFIFKFPDGSIKRFVYSEDSEQEILDLCGEFNECVYTSFIEMLRDVDFYEENYFADISYELKPALESDIPKLIDYKLKSILDYAKELTIEEKTRIDNYVRENVPSEINNYRIIYVLGSAHGCVLVTDEDDGVLLDEIYVDKNYRGMGIGTRIIKDIISSKKIVYLWVYKNNDSAISLYKKLGFKVIQKTRDRYYMKCMKEVQ